MGVIFVADFQVRTVRRHMQSVCVLAALTAWDACAIAIYAQTRPSQLRATDAAITEGDPVVGTWELDITASTFAPGPPPTSELRVYEPEHEGIKATVVTIFGDGRRSIFEYVITAAVTGRTRRVISQDGQAMTIELHRDAPVAVNNVTVYRRR